MLERFTLNKVIFITLFIILIFLLIFILYPERVQISMNRDVFYISKRDPLTVSFERGKFFLKKITNVELNILPEGSCNILERENDFLIFYNTNKVIDNIKLEINYKGKKFITNLSVVLPLNDFDRDGYPDFMEEINRKNFVEWFCVIVESQFYYPSDEWYDVHKDCAGLIEFAYKMALMKHSEDWVKKFKYLPDVSIPDENIFYYPDIPYLGRRVFRVREGSFNTESIDVDFSETASGSLLRNYSMVFKGRDYRDAEKGDIFFFFDDNNLKMPSHSMVFFKDVEPYFIYHTGPDITNKGFVKKVFLKELLNHPKIEWRPVPENKNFVGIYRWKILD
ncbi:MAG: DUF1175 domain-containing protein [Brevinematales bacterium]|nr:DUF1175 domain-containing protein [Brevinematales bacterium]